MNLPYCNIPLNDLNSDDYVIRKEQFQGNVCTVIHYSDGSTTYCGGGPAAPMSYDKYGREC